MDNTFIYALVDPRDSKRYYVGKSNDPEKRLQQHLEDTKSNHLKAKWIKDLLSEGIEPELDILASVMQDEWQEYEKHWITKSREEGHPLTNISDGGTGASCYHNPNHASISHFVANEFGGELSILFDRVDFEAQKQVLKSMALTVMATSELIQRAYRHFDAEIPLTSCDPVAIGLKILNGETRLLELIDEAGDEMIVVIDKYIAEAHN